MIRIGVTGGIGSGKTFICQRLAQVFKLPVFDCDSIAKQLMTGNPKIRETLVTLVGENAYTAQGVPDKSVMAHYVFSSAENARKVEKIVHPLVLEEFENWCSSQASQAVVIESALLYKNTFHEVVDKVIYVDAPVALRTKRAMSRDNADVTKIEERIALQEDSLMRQMADYTLTNDGLQDVDDQLTQIMNSINIK